MPDCEYFEELCSASLDGELTRAQKRELDKHLAECPTCAAWLEDLKFMRTAWGDIKAPLPEELHEKIMGHITDTLPAPAPPRKHTPPVFTIIAAAAACVLLALSGAFGDLFGGLEVSHPAASANTALDSGTPESRSMKASPSTAETETDSHIAPMEKKAAADEYTIRSVPENAAASLAVSLPEELQAYHFGFCYVAVGSSDPPALEQASLIEKDGNLYYFSIENSMSGMEKLREQLQEAGYETAQRSDIGIISDDSAQLSLLIISVIE